MPSSPSMPRFARRETYGGCPDISFEAAGYFRPRQ
jgi:hypothetical protein